MSNIAIGTTVGKKLTDLLGITGRVNNLTVEVPYNGPVTVKITRYLTNDDSNAVIKELSQYKLEKIV